MKHYLAAKYGIASLLRSLAHHFDLSVIAHRILSHFLAKLNITFNGKYHYSLAFHAVRPCEPLVLGCIKHRLYSPCLLARFESILCPYLKPMNYKNLPARLFVFILILFSAENYAQTAGGDENCSWPLLNQAHPVYTNLDVLPIKAPHATFHGLQESNTGVFRNFVEWNNTFTLPGMGNRGFRAERNNTLSQSMKDDPTAPRTYTVSTSSNPAIWGKLELTSKGVFAMIFEPGKGTMFIRPVKVNGFTVHMAYRKSDFITDKQMSCEVEELAEENSARAGEPFSTCELKTYRIAISATGEYTEFHGGESEDALAAMATTLNRVNGIYERDLGVTFTLVEDNDLLIFTDPDTDPFTNGSPGAMIGENQDLIDDVIGSANYDIGHVFGTNSGGLAGFGVICSNNQKARGVTGGPAPIGDPFDIDYVAHEIGHQFGGSHSFNNSCNGNRSNANAVEPGSGTTIMAYAGICTPNIQNQSDDHFHGNSLEQMGNEIASNGCQVVTELVNVAPILSLLPSNIYIPVSTPFALTASAVDANGDSLTYCWEQMDNEISPQPPEADSPDGPNFRSISPEPNPTRYFPDLQSLASGGPFTWEQLPSVQRSMNFRVSVRDNAATAGCTEYDDLTVNVLDEGGSLHRNLSKHTRHYLARV